MLPNKLSKISHQHRLELQQPINTSRRQALKTLALGGLAIASPSLLAKTSEPEKPQKPIKPPGSINKLTIKGSIKRELSRPNKKRRFSLH